MKDLKDLDIVALGDSLTFGYPYGVDFSWPQILVNEKGLKIINKGINGDTTQNMLKRFGKDVLKLSPDIVIITGGANDLFDYMPFDIMKNNITKMLDICKNNNITPIIGIPLPTDDMRFKRKLNRYIDFLRRFSCKKIDFYSALVDKNSSVIKAEFDLDGLHPNKKGYIKMAEKAWSVLKHFSV